jgi:hypothetical protein
MPATSASSVATGLVVAAAALAVFAASLPGNLDRSVEDRAAHAAGADVRAAGAGAVQAASASGPESMAVARVDAEVSTPRGSRAIRLLGVEPAALPGVALLRDDFGGGSPQQLAGTLAANTADLAGIAVPEGTRQLGAWLHATRVDGGASVVLRVRDASGVFHELLLGRIEPGAGGAWRFFATDLDATVGIDGAATGVLESASGGLTLHGFYVALDDGAAAGEAAFGAVLATTDAPVAPPDPGGSAQGFARRAIVHDLATAGGWEPIVDFEAAAGDIIAEPGSTDAPPGFSGSFRLRWPAAETPRPDPASRCWLADAGSARRWRANWSISRPLKGAASVASPSPTSAGLSR